MLKKWIPAFARKTVKLLMITGKSAGLQPHEFFQMLAIEPHGCVPWKQKVEEDRPGVYVISIDDPSSVTADQLPDRERSYWIVDQPIIYIGRATSLKRRLLQFYRHEYGARSPHRGGQAILKIGDCPKWVHYAATEDIAGAARLEHLLLTAFETQVGRKAIRKSRAIGSNKKAKSTS